MLSNFSFFRSFTFPAALIAACMAIASCKSTSTAPPQENLADSATYSLIKSQIFQSSCAQCHNDSMASFNGNLSLQGDTAYPSLVNVLSFNSLARADSILRVMPSHSATSFLFRKLTGVLDPGMGNPMPSGGHPLSAGKVEFIRQWIDAGAPRTGSVADVNLLQDTTADLQAPLVPLPVPSADSGFQIHMPPFDIPAGSEREIFLYKDNPNSDTKYVTSMDIRMREGSHHFILWGVDGAAQGLVDGDLRDRSSMEMERPRDFYNGAQTQELNYTFPPGVALEIPQNEGFDLNSHYVNPTNQVMHGEAYMNLYTVPYSQVQHIAQSFLLADMNFFIPPHSTYTRKYLWQAVTAPTHLIMLSSHAHSHMVSFKVWLNRPMGKPIYENYDWHEPTVANMDLILQPGDQLYSETTWTNDGDTPLTWGYTSQDEMNVLLGFMWQ